MLKTIGTIEIDGKKIILRFPKPSDYKKCHKFYNQAIKESLEGGGFISSTKPVTLQSEKRWVTDIIKKIKKKKAVCILAEYHGRIIGNTDIRKEEFGAIGHIGNFGIVILHEFTRKGLGTRMMEEILPLAKKQLKIEIVKLGVFSNNKRAIRLYKKMGFKEAGKIKKGVKVKGRYQDHIQMVKHLK